MATHVNRTNEFDVLSDAWQAGLSLVDDATTIAGVRLSTRTAFPWLVHPVFNAVWDAVWDYRTRLAGGRVPWTD